VTSPSGLGKELCGTLNPQRDRKIPKRKCQATGRRGRLDCQKKEEGCTKKGAKREMLREKLDGRAKGEGLEQRGRRYKRFRLFLRSKERVPGSRSNSGGSQERGENGGKTSGHGCDWGTTRSGCTNLLW